MSVDAANDDDTSPTSIATYRLTLTEELDLFARFDVLAMQRQWGATGRLCEFILSNATRGSSTAFLNQWHFWLCFSQAQCGLGSVALTGLEQIQGDGFSLPVTAFKIQLKGREKTKDKEAIAALQASLKIISKQHTSPSALLLATRFFLYSDKLSKARQCWMKLAGKTTKDVNLLNIAAAMDLREGDIGMERSRRITRKAIRLASLQSHIQASSSEDAIATPATTSPNPSLLLSSYLRLQQLDFVGEWTKSLREVEHLCRIFPNYLPTFEWQAKLLACKGEWKKAVEWSEEVLAKLAEAATASKPSEFIENDSVALRWSIALNSLLNSPSLSSSSLAFTKLSAFVKTLLELEGSNVGLLTSSARSILALSRSESVVLDMVEKILTKAMSAQRKLHPSSDHSTMSSLLSISGSIHLLRKSPEEALEEFIEAFVLDENSTGSLLGQVEALLALKRWDEAKKLLASLPPIISNNSNTTATPPIPSSSDYLRPFLDAQLSYGQSSDLEKCITLLSSAIDAHAALIYSRTHPAPIVGESSSIQKRAWNAVQDEDYFSTLDAQHVQDMGQLYLSVLGNRWKSFESPLTPEESYREEVLDPLAAMVFHLSTAHPSNIRIFLLSAQLSWIQQDYAACRKAVHRCGVLRAAIDGKGEKGEKDKDTPRPSTTAGATGSNTTSPRRDPWLVLVSQSLNELVALLRQADAFDSPTHALQAARRAATVQGGVYQEQTQQRIEQLMTPRAIKKSKEKPAATTLNVSSPAAYDSASSTPTGSGKVTPLFNTSASASRLKGTPPIVAQRHRKLASDSMVAASPNDSDDELELLDLDLDSEQGSQHSSSSNLHGRHPPPTRSKGHIPAESIEIDEAEAEYLAVAALASAGAARTASEQAELQRAEQARERVRAAEMRRRAEEEVREALDTSSRKGSRRVSRLGRDFSDKDLKDAGNPMGRSHSGSSLNMAHSRNSSATSLNAYPPTVPYLSHYSSGHLLMTSHSDKSVGVSGSTGGGSHGGSGLNSGKGATLGLGTAGGKGQSSSHTTLPMPSSASMSSLEYSNMIRVSPASTPSPHQTNFDVTAAAFYHAGGPSGMVLHANVADRTHGHHPSGSSDTSSSSPPAPTQPRSYESALLASKKHAVASHNAAQEAADHFRTVASHGASFWKHGRSGDPHQRTIKMTCSHSGGTEELKFDWGSDKMYIRREEFKLVQGKQTEVFQRSTAAKSKSELCFSIVGRHRTLDLEAPNKELKTVWVDGLLNLIAYFPKPDGTHSGPSSGRGRESSSSDRESSVSGSSNSFFGAKTGPALSAPVSTGSGSNTKRSPR